MTGYVHSFQSLGAVDGPGIRFVVFMQGCPLRCACCHNPDTHAFGDGNTYTPTEVYEKVARYREYFGKDGGITVSGGEPLCQAEFVTELFALCRENGINTCIDTSGCVLDGSVLGLLDVTDRVLLDVKYTNEEDYERYVGCKLSDVLRFLDCLDEKRIPTTLRQVIIPEINGSEANVRALKRIADSAKCVDKIELLPFRKICTVKYDNMGIAFPFADKNEPTPELMAKLNGFLA